MTIEEAYEKWAPDLVSYASLLVGPGESADLVADVFAGLLAADPASWLVVREPRSYLFGAVTRSAQMHHRGRLRRQRREWRVASGQVAVDGHLSDPAVVAALRSLSVQQRAVVYLTYWADLDPAAVAALLGVRPGSVKRHLARARSRLREVMS